MIYLKFAYSFQHWLNHLILFIDILYFFYLCFPLRQPRQKLQGNVSPFLPILSNQFISNFNFFDYSILILNFFTILIINFVIYLIQI